MFWYSFCKQEKKETIDVLPKKGLKHTHVIIFGSTYIPENIGDYLLLKMFLKTVKISLFADNMILYLKDPKNST
jgi:hypothetical protein